MAWYSRIAFPRALRARDAFVSLIMGLPTVLEYKDGEEETTGGLLLVGTLYKLPLDTEPGGRSLLEIVCLCPLLKRGDPIVFAFASRDDAVDIGKVELEIVEGGG